MTAPSRDALAVPSPNLHGSFAAALRLQPSSEGRN